MLSFRLSATLAKVAATSAKALAVSSVLSDFPDMTCDNIDPASLQPSEAETRVDSPLCDFWPDAAGLGDL